MTIVRSVAEYRALGLEDVGFVPTMGALHDGHCSLIRATAHHSNRVISIFVNPTQFGPNEDLTRYPRPFDQDVEKATSAGANVIFAPTAEAMYPEAPSMIRVPIVSERFEGASRPGHFEGVATIVAKLFNIIQPSVAYFGQKDLQQCSVICKMVNDLNLPVEVRIEPTLREKDGLAMSSRNIYLSEKERRIAPMIYQELVAARDAISNGSGVENVMMKSSESLKSNGFNVDYFKLVDRTHFSPTNTLCENCAIVVAAKLGTTRLIDNILVS